jgi:6-pyruvoyltetrahydropterin/6-carboxytetrahydropterin synthase
MPKVYLTRRETFSASHRLHSEKISGEENKKLFGKCNSENGHGHNYVLEVTVYGEVDLKTGLVLNLADLKQIMDAHVLSKVDHKHLNLDVEEFKSLNPTTENLAIVVWKWLAPHLPLGLLHQIKIFETEKNIAVYSGN